ncbi:MAG TPA: inorganic pyrophosphatase [Deltaproteobacteria bacterium]|nr:inorganic pyrophosphatase [Deltaproteobacteria bacterium]
MENRQFNLWQPHPWHGLEIGPEPPRVVNAYIEITPFDLVKYEVDKRTGYLRVDRPHRTSSQPPALYGFIPRTLCGERFQRLSPRSLRGGSDPLDICVVSERPITKSEIVLLAKVVGGLQMIDDDEADDKIVAVLVNDYIWNWVEDVRTLPSVLIERLEHYFSTYKLVAGEEPKISIDNVYGHLHAWQVIEAAIADYRAAFEA